MKKQMKRTVYEAPVTERFSVELEGTFCASAEVDNPETEGGRVGEIGNQNISGDFSDFDDKFATDGWN